eukprot:353715-Chlamydomonas_euryale.AAC.3
MTQHRTVSLAEWMEAAHGTCTGQASCCMHTASHMTGVQPARGGATPATLCPSPNTPFSVDD